MNLMQSFTDQVCSLLLKSVFCHPVRLISSEAMFDCVSAFSCPRRQLHLMLDRGELTHFLLQEILSFLRCSCSVAASGSACVDKALGLSKACEIPITCFVAAAIDVPRRIPSKLPRASRLLHDRFPFKSPLGHVRGIDESELDWCS